jgi:aspartate carbamoyltransferase catalytic subunit
VDCLVLRHHDDDAGSRAARVSVVPIVSAGIGYREHPTQALGDVWTMVEAVGRLDGAVVGLIGDVAIRSLRPISMVLSRFKLKRLLFLPAPGTEVPADVVACLAAGGIDWGQAEHVQELLAVADVIETIGIRHPQHNLPRQDAADEAPDASTPDRFRLTRAVLETVPRVVPILHPGGRKDELSTDVDGMPHARYWNQITNNLWMRVAILAAMLTKEGPR